MRLAKAAISAFLCAVSVSAFASNPFVAPAQADLGVLKKLDEIERRVQENTMRIEDAMMGGFARSGGPRGMGGAGAEVTGTVLPGGVLIGRINGECVFEFQSGDIVKAGPDDCRAMLMFQSGVLANQKSHVFFVPGCPGFMDVPEADRITFLNVQAARNMGYELSPTCSVEGSSTDSGSRP